MGKIFGKPYAQTFVEGLSSDAKASFASALDDNGDFLRVDLDLGPTALQETYEEDACAKCALSFGGKELQGVICYTSETAYDFVSYEPQDEMRFWEIDAETCELTEILTHEKVTLGDLRLALGGGSGGGFDPADIPEGDVLQNAILGLNEDGEAVKGNLFGKYVRVMTAPESSTLTPEQIEIFKNGVFITGTFLNQKNPVFLPAVVTSTYEPGNIFGFALSGSQIFVYTITEAGVITIDSNVIGFYVLGKNYADISIITNHDLTLTCSRHLTIKNFYFPQAIQDNKNRYLIARNREGIWQDGNGLYLHTIVFDVGSGNSFTIRLISDSATACAKDATSGNFGIDGATFINRANMDNIVLRPFGANQFNPDVYAFDTTTGTYSDQFTLADVTSDTVTPIG